MYVEWPLFATLLDNVQLSLAKADLHIAAMYAGLVREAAVRERIFGLVEAEHGRTLRAVLAATGQSRLLEHDPEQARSIERRNPYVDPLSYIQVALLGRLRAEGVDDAERQALTRSILLTINALAAGLRSTG
jgi:phosphoenolpyruvate carboxylase